LTTKTWFTKGLRRIVSRHNSDMPLFWRQRPDLRRDCDFIKTLEWFYCGHYDDKDLIYEGIATCIHFVPFVLSATTKTWFTKGLRLVLLYFSFLGCAHATTKTWFTKGLRPNSKDIFYRGLWWRQRPDLRRDCDVLRCCDFSHDPLDDKDLIYEGIATKPCPAFLSWLLDDKDLIYEGIATILFARTILSRALRRQRPDLRRDCDLMSSFSFTSLITDDKDLIYEGIATRWRSCDFSGAQLTTKTWFTKGLRPESIRAKVCQQCRWWRQRPDLRRDCDCRRHLHTFFTLFSMTTKTWFTKGLRLCVDILFRKAGSGDDKDLIYEGIATLIACEFNGNIVTTKTWFTKGLRLFGFRTPTNSKDIF